ncbi:MAG: MFS transporter, partial [Bacteroidales bacterium]|nr:MFS transporter [Bacteroidales bacterium]
MAQKTKQWGAIIVMIALFAMIAFVTNLCSPMAVIVKNQFGASNFLAQIGNYGNFGAYLVMGLPSGMLIKKYGYKKTALIALAVGIVGILVQWISGSFGFAVYLCGALISGACMCMLNTVVNPMLNLLGGGGNSGNQLIQIGGVFNSSAAVAVYIIMGALIGEATKAKISDATPALMIALAIFVIAFLVILFTKIEEPEQPKDNESQSELVKGALSYRHFVLGIIAICVYGAVEVGPPTYILQYLTAAKDAATPGLAMDA